MESKIYYKITNAEENHHGFQYQNGLNILKEPFNDNSYNRCCAGGLYFTDIENIFEFLNYGIYLREITLPNDKPEFKMVKDVNKYRANMIILGKRYELFKVETYKMLIERGADVHADNDFALRFSAKNGHLEVVKYLIKKGANIHADYDYALRCSAYNDYALKYSAENGYLEVVKYLIEKGANIDVIKNYPIMEKLK